MILERYENDHVLFCLEYFACTTGDFTLWMREKVSGRTMYKRSDDPRALMQEYEDIVIQLMCNEETTA